MASSHSIFLGRLMCICLAQIAKIFTYAKVYVVYIAGNEGDILLKIHQILASVNRESIEEAQASHFYSYNHGFRGFAARLTDDRVLQLSNMPEVLCVIENKRRSLYTTHSWDFIGLVGEETMEIPVFSTKDQLNVIIGFIDTDVKQCQFEYGGDPKNERSYRSTRDNNGHGTCTASTTIRCYMMGMNYKGLAQGGAAMARVAVYKTCCDSGCYDAYVLAAFDVVVRDKVHILSLSLGTDAPQGDYFSESISIGSFHAVSHVITVVSW